MSLPPVLVLDAEIRQALAACRALRAAGFPVAASGRGSSALAGDSRDVVRYHRLPLPEDGPVGGPFGVALEGVLRAHGYAAVVAVDDATLARLDAEPPSVPTVPAGGGPFDRLTAKDRLGDVCAAAGVDYPTTLPVPSGGERAAVEAVGLPCVVKAARSAAVAPSGIAYVAGAVVATTLEEVVTAANAVRTTGGEPVVQARIRGVAKLNAVVIRRDGRAVLRYAHRVLREVPPGRGIGISLVTIPADRGPGAAAVDALDRICATAGWSGVAHAEVYERADGGLTLIEVNPRLWGSTWFAERLGLRVTERCVRDALGLEPLPDLPAYEVGRRFHHAPGLLTWARAPRAERDPLRSLIGTVAPNDVFDIVSLRDPSPFLGLLRRRLTASRPAARRARTRET